MTPETSTTNNPAGVYKHPVTGAEVVVRHDAKYGTAQADGFTRVGFVYDRPASHEDEPKQVEEPEVQMGVKTAAELRMELAEAEAREGGQPAATAGNDQKALHKQTKEELRATADAEGVEVTDDLDTNKKLADAIQAHRDNKESEQE